VSDASDPEEARVTALVTRTLEGTLTAAEHEELALYAESDPRIGARIDQAAQQARLGRGWLERVQGDARIERVERGRRARLERGIGLALLASGYPLTLLAPLVGFMTLGAGVFVLMYSFVRVRLATHDEDPYKDVVR
jgi:hypothetical protein